MKIDVFAHILPPEYCERARPMIERRGDAPLLEEWDVSLDEVPALRDVDARLSSIDRFDDYRQVLVPGSPPVEVLGEADEVAAMTRDLNDELADLVASHPDRFVGFVAALPMNSVELALAEMDRAIDKLGALGVLLYTNVNGRPLDDPSFEPLFGRAEELDRPIWLHPHRRAEWSDYPYGGEAESRYVLYWTFGWPYETAIAMARLAYSGVMERHPGVKVITHHGGGLIPHWHGRLRERPWGPESDGVLALPHPPVEYLKRFYADTALMGATHAVRCALEFFGIDQMLFGSDFGYGEDYFADGDYLGKGYGNDYLAKAMVDVTELGLDEASSRKLFEENARRVLRLE